MSTIQEGTFRSLFSDTGDGVTTTYSINGAAAGGALYLNGLLQEEYSDYTTSNSVDGKGNPVVDFTFNVAPDNGSKISIYGQPGWVSDSAEFGNLTPLA